MASGDCVSCGFPINVSRIGEELACPDCHTVNKAVSAVTVPTPLFVGVLGFALGVILGPAVLSSTKGGAEFLERKARERLSS